MMEKILVVAKKEIIENLKSIRFWGLIALFVLFYIASTYAVGFALRGFGGLVPTGRQRVVLQLSSNVAGAFNYIAPLLGIALGFGAIAAEREKGTIRLVLSRPIYRDDFINGKMIAAALLILLALGLSTLIAMPTAVVLQGITVTAEDFVRLLLLLLPATLLAFAYYSLALFASVNSSRSSHALVFSLVLWIFFSFVLPLLASFIAFYMLGPPPAISFRFNATRPFQPGQEPTQLREYYQKYSQITSTIELISPNARFQSLSQALFALRQQTSAYEELGAVLLNRWIDIVIPAVYIAVFTLLSYLVFLRKQETR
ncbi:MAG: ABC transporter permease [Thermofilaceae archaeon]